MQLTKTAVTTCILWTSKYIIRLFPGFCPIYPSGGAYIDHRPNSWWEGLGALPPRILPDLSAPDFKLRLLQRQSDNSNYITAEQLDRQMLGFSGLYKVFIIFYQTLSTAVLWFPNPQCKYNLYKNSFISLYLFKYE